MLGYATRLQHFTSTCHPRSNSSQPSSASRPLEGVIVVSIEQAIAAPYCTRQLADMGARVIKVERPGVGDFARDYDTRVDGLASHFVWTNRSKESLALDLKKPKELGMLKKLLGQADVLVQNLAPGATARMGLSYEALRAENPKLIVCDISGYGQDGPYRTKKAYDLLIQSESGMLSVTGTGSEPAKVGISIADIAAGMYAYTNILAAILQRQKTGQGCKIDISMLESMVEWMGFPMYYTHKKAPGPTPAGASHAAIYPYGPFETGDGQSVMLGIQNEREWTTFCVQLLDNADLVKDPRFCNNSQRTENRTELRDIIYDAFSKLTAAEAVAQLDSAGIANANVNDMQGVWDHPQLRERGRWTEVDTPIGRVPALIPPGVPSHGTEDSLRARMDPVPAVGEHNAAIFKSFGLEDSS
ncbi:CoA-transferase family III [Eremomyces bilateralis CBS 781.70]|uniref:CoA-transferase family III n=1 Tax=Eremomyces bilateralis CBS 781.70 TaxID=1392243 RepID=A0A6G1GFN6_9PEZI|nr:CoA-transferase family III [Eremomyces bilateralis CBS 781.70]KAF1816897.1 CoA-transferase family III [Eremomyces bilateralis CBS 781.70]